MTPNQRKLLIVLSFVVVSVFVAVAIAALTGSPNGDTSPGSTMALPSTTAATTTTSVAATTGATLDTTTSTSSTTTSSTSSTTTTTEAPGPTLAEDGLGEVTFGTEAETAITRLSELLGTPDEDGGWEPSFSVFGTCPGEQVRGVRWGTLWALFTDGSTEWRADGTRHFFTYINSVFYDDSRSLGLLTEEGIGLGDSLASLTDAYGSRLTVAYEDLLEVYVFAIDVPPPGLLWGALTGDRPDSLITTIEAGRGCGE